jgi:hypothetical protein
MKGKKKFISLPKTPAWRSVQNMKGQKKNSICTGFGSIPPKLLWE